MPYSPYKTKNLLNASTGVMTAMQDESPDTTDAFDKRSGGVPGAGLAEKIDIAKDYMDNMSKALGSQSPYYTIGEINPVDSNQHFSAFGQNALGNVVRAVAAPLAKFSWGQKALEAVGLGGEYQQGVIIDGFGTVSGSIDIKFTESPVLFVGTSISDGRYRTPNTVQMRVYVSNYYNDDLIGMGVDYLASSVPGSGALATFAKNVALYGGNTRAQQALYNLRKIQESGKPFVLYTPHGRYENMMIESLRPVTDDKNVDMLECDITFKEVIMYEVYHSSSAKNPITIPARQNVGSDSPMYKRLGWAK